MKGYQFHLEYPDSKSRRKATRKELGNHEGNVIAIALEGEGRSLRKVSYISSSGVEYEGFVAIMLYGNSPVTYSSVGKSYLQEHTKRISEAQARQIHPELFKRLDKDKS